MASDNVIQLTDSSFDTEVTNFKGVVLVDFWAAWCGPCRAIAPVIEEIATEYSGKAKISKMNVDENQMTPGKFNIRAIPTMILFKDGKVVDQITGAVGKNLIISAIDKAIA
jgi:thioredoxin 1